jgi:hypothetical protein
MFSHFILCSVPFHNNQRGILSLLDCDFKIFLLKPGRGGFFCRQSGCATIEKPMFPETAKIKKPAAFQMAAGLA